MGVENPNEIIVSTIGGKTFRSCRQCAAHLRKTIETLAKRWPGKTLRIIQPSFNTGVKASAGTHDKCGCFDVDIIGLGWDTAQRFLRSCGWAAWWRKPSQGFPNHIHMCSINCNAPQGIFVHDQIVDYYRHTFGLAGMHNIDLDKSWFPGDEGDPPWPVGTPLEWRIAINETLFDYEDWLDEQMTPEQIDALANKVKNQTLDEVIDTVDGTDITVRMALKRAAATPDLVRENKSILENIREAIDKIKPNVSTIKNKVTAIQEKLGA